MWRSSPSRRRRRRRRRSLRSPCSPPPSSPAPLANPSPLRPDVCIVALPDRLIVASFVFRSSPRAPSALLPLFRCIVGRSSAGSLASSSERLIVMCDVCWHGAVGLRASFQLCVSSQKTAAVGDGCRPVPSAGMIAAGVRPRSPPSGTRGLSHCRCCHVVLCPRGRSVAVAGGSPSHGRQRPLPTCTHRDGNRHLHPMACFAARGKGG